MRLSTMGGFLSALQFLTRLPVRTGQTTPRQISESYCFYPVIGFLIGITAVMLRRFLAMAFPVPFSITLVLGFLIWITGGLHEDGLADVADGMGGGYTPDERLTIMKDSRIGALGTAALILALLGKYSALTSMDPARLDASLVTAHILGRWIFLPVGFFNRPARDGLGSEFMKGLTAKAVVISTVISITAVSLLCRMRGAFAVAIAIAIAALASAYLRRRLGGITGDCLGAIFQLVEIGTYAVFLA
jgi:adenosylcobinamide-GDP ribazoletransferase